MDIQWKIWMSSFLEHELSKTNSSRERMRADEGILIVRLAWNLWRTNSWILLFDIWMRSSYVYFL